MKMNLSLSSQLEESKAKVEDLEVTLEEVIEENYDLRSMNSILNGRYSSVLVETGRIKDENKDLQKQIKNMNYLIACLLFLQMLVVVFLALHKIKNGE